MRPLLMTIPVLALAACGDSTGPDRSGPIDLETLFGPATAAEMAAVESEWATRDPRAEDVEEVTSSLVLLGGGFGTARVFSHEVDGNRHYGATLVPLGAAPGSLPVVVFAHGGDDGVNVNDLALILLLLGDRTRDYVYVVPSFRSEPLTLGDGTWRSGGEPSPWDRDVDDALAFLEVALEHTPEADSSRIGVLGASRGGTVALLMAVRDPRIDFVAELAGPTDFLGPWMRGLTADALDGDLRPLPGVHVLNERFIQPLADGLVTPAAFRLELVRRSPVLWTDRLPPVHIHHGTADDVVPIGQAEVLIDALEALDREGMEDAVYLYPGAGHNLLELREIDSRVISFLERLREM